MHDENSNNSVHVEQKPFDREHCGLGFETEKDLKNHIELVHDENCNNSVHDEQKSFDCKHCGVGFETEKDLKKHTESVHGENHQFSLARAQRRQEVQKIGMCRNSERVPKRLPHPENRHRSHAVQGICSQQHENGVSAVGSRRERVKYHRQ